MWSASRENILREVALREASELYCLLRAAFGNAAAAAVHSPALWRMAPERLPRQLPALPWDRSSERPLDLGAWLQALVEHSVGGADRPQLGLPMVRPAGSGLAALRPPHRVAGEPGTAEQQSQRPMKTPRGPWRCYGPGLRKHRLETTISVFRGPACLVRFG